MTITVRMYSGPAPKKKPKAGDEKTLKDGTVMIDDKSVFRVGRWK